MMHLAFSKITDLVQGCSNTIFHYNGLLTAKWMTAGSLKMRCRKATRTTYSCDHLCIGNPEKMIPPEWPLSEVIPREVSYTFSILFPWMIDWFPMGTIFNDLKKLTCLSGNTQGAGAKSALRCREKCGNQKLQCSSGRHRWKCWPRQCALRQPLTW
jgi:hypothetical protein